MKKFLEWVLNNLTSLIIAIAPTAVVIFTGVWAYIKRYFSILDLVLLLVVVIQAAIFISVAVWRAKSYKSYYYPRSKIRYPYIINKKVTNYKINNHDKLAFSRELNVKSKTDNLHIIEDKYIWTGKSNANTPVRRKNVQEIRDEAERRGVWRFYNVLLSRHISKGDELEVAYDWDEIDDYTSSSPFVSSSTEMPTKELVFHIDLGAKYKDAVLILEEYRAIEGDNPLKVNTVNFDDHGKYTWTISKPKRFRYFIARWEWIRG